MTPDETPAATGIEDRQRTGAARLERALARSLVIAGGAFWVIAAFAGPYVYPDMTLAESAKTAVWPLLTTMLILGLGWKHEQLAAVLLSGAAAAVFVWGAIYGWNVEAWMFMLLVVIGPMALAAVLFVLSSRWEEEPPVG